jgi:hypothetical protein
MPTRICSSTSAALEAIRDGDVPELTGTGHMTLPWEELEVHCISGTQTLVVRGAPTLQIKGTAETVLSLLGPASPNMLISGESRAVITVDLQTPPNAPVPTLTIEEHAAPTVTVFSGAPIINVNGSAIPTINLLNDCSAIVRVSGGARPSIVIATSGEFLVELDEEASGNIDVRLSTYVGMIRSTGNVTTEMNLREQSKTAIDIAGRSHPHVYMWNFSSSTITSRESSSPSVSTYHQSNLIIEARGDSAATVDAHHNTQIESTGRVAIRADRSVSVELCGGDTTIEGACLRKTRQ